MTMWVAFLSGTACSLGELSVKDNSKDFSFMFFSGPGQIPRCED